MYAVLPFRYNALTMALNQPVCLYSLSQSTLHKHHQDYPSGPYNDIWFQDSNTSSQLCRSWSGTTMRGPWTKMSGMSEKLEQKWSPFLGFTTTCTGLTPMPRAPPPIAISSSTHRALVRPPQVSSCPNATLSNTHGDPNGMQNCKSHKGCRMPWPFCNALRFPLLSELIREKHE